MRKQLNKSEIKSINDELEKRFSLRYFFDKKDNLVYEEINGFNFLKNHGEPMFFYYKDQLVPTLKLLLKQDLLKEVVVDSGAIKFVSSGADVMRPGIVKIESGIKNQEFVVIKEESYIKPIAIGVALFPGEDIEQMTSGKVIKTIHFIGDKIWNA